MILRAINFGPSIHIDDCDRELDKYRWYIDGDGYVVTCYKSKHYYLHKMIAEKLGWFGRIDHIDRNRLNNHRSNLRQATNSQNLANANLSISNKSGFRGVYKHTKSGKWIAQICISGKNKNLGSFNIPEDAARAYDKAALEIFGEFANPNFKE